MCVTGALRAGHELMQKIADPGFRCYYVWTPILAADSEAAARYNEGAMQQRGARHYWDPDRSFERHMAVALGLDVAWDLYLLYPRGDPAIEQPDFWMHQLDTDKAPRLDPEVLKNRITEKLGR